jgi:hypothetical protein
MCTVWSAALDNILATKEDVRYDCRSNVWEMYLHRGVRPLRPTSDRCKHSPMTNALWSLTENCWRRDREMSLSAAQVVSHLARSTE